MLCTTCTYWTLCIIPGVVEVTPPTSSMIASTATIAKVIASSISTLITSKVLGIWLMRRTSRRSLIGRRLSLVVVVLTTCWRRVPGLRILPIATLAASFMYGEMKSTLVTNTVVADSPNYLYPNYMVIVEVSCRSLA